MRSSTWACVCGVLAGVTVAQNPFSFNNAIGTIAVGQAFNVTWSPSTGTQDTVSLILREGESTDLVTVLTIASGIQNTGFYVWTPPATLPKGSQYAFEIVDDGNEYIVNYSAQFSIDSSVPASTPAAASPSTTSTSSASSASLATGSVVNSAGTLTAASTSESTPTTAKTTASVKATSTSTVSESKTSSSASSTASQVIESLTPSSGQRAIPAGGALGLVGLFVLGFL